MNLNIDMINKEKLALENISILYNLSHAEKWYEPETSLVLKVRKCYNALGFTIHTNHTV